MSKERPDFSIKPHVLLYLKTQQNAQAKILVFWCILLAFCVALPNVAGVVTQKAIDLQTIRLIFSFKQIILAILYTNLRLLMALCLALFMAGLCIFSLQKNKLLYSILFFFSNVTQSIPAVSFFFFAILILNYFHLTIFLSYGAVVFITLSIILMWRFVASFQCANKLLSSDLKLLSQSLRLTSWQKFWTIYCPHAIPFLTETAKRSMADAWFALIFMEGFSAVSNVMPPLKGIGLIAVMAAQQKNILFLCFLGLAVLTSLIIQNQLLFFPLSAWSTRYHIASMHVDSEKEPWVLKGLRRSVFFERVVSIQRILWRKFSMLNIGKVDLRKIQFHTDKYAACKRKELYISLLVSVILYLCFIFFEGKNYFLFNLENILPSIFESILRVWGALFFVTLVWVPIGVYVGQSPAASRWIIKGARYASVFPFNIFYPLCALSLISWHLPAAIWICFFLALGAQWTIFLSVMEGMQNFPSEILDMRKSFQISGTLFLRKIVFPGIFPYYLMGIISAASMTWNAVIAAEAVSYGLFMSTTNGIGCFIVDALKNDSKVSVFSGVIVIAIITEATNLCIWRPLARYAVRAFATTDKVL